MPTVVMRVDSWTVSEDAAAILEKHGHIWRYDDDPDTYGVVGESESEEEFINASIVEGVAAWGDEDAD